MERFVNEKRLQNLLDSCKDTENIISVQMA